MNWLARLLALFRPRPRPSPAPPPKPTPDPVPHAPGGLVSQLNAVRASNGVRPVVEDARATAAAQIQSDWQAKRDRIGHDGPPGMPTEVERLAAQGVVNRACGEIAAEGPEGWGYTFSTAIQDWLTSPGHRSILLDPSYTIAGAATATAASGNLYSTAVFVQ